MTYFWSIYLWALLGYLWFVFGWHVEFSKARPIKGMFIIMLCGPYVWWVALCSLWRVRVLNKWRRL